MKQITTHPLNQKKIPAEVLEVITALTLSAENITNSNLFNQRNVLSSYQYKPETKTYKIKEDTHDHQFETLKIFNEMIVLINEDRTQSWKSKWEKWNALPIEKKLAVDKDEKLIHKEPKNNKLLTPFTAEITPETYWQINDKTLVEKVLKKVESTRDENKRDYAMTPSGYAQNILHQSVQTMKNHRASLISYALAPESFTGKPKLPNYLSSGSRCGFEFSSTRILNDGSFPNILKTHQLYLDKEKTKPVSPESIQAYNSFNFKALIDAKMAKMNPEAELGIIRFNVVKRSSKGQKVKVTFTISEDWDFPKDSFAALVDKTDPQFFEKNARDQAKSIQKILETNKLPSMAGGDLGLRNLITIVFSKATKTLANKVFSGKSMTSSLNKIDKQMDKRIKELANPEVQRLREKAEQENALRAVNKNYQTILNEKEIKILHDFNATICNDQKYLKLLEHKNDRVNDICHKISRAIVDLMVKNGIELIILGQNIGWKDELN